MSDDAPKKKESDGPDLMRLVVIGLFALFAIGAAVVLSVPNLVQPPMMNNRSAAIGALKTIYSTQTIFREGDKEGDELLDYGTLQELSDAGLIDPQLGTGTRQGFRFDVRPSTKTSEFLWFAVANPVTPGRTGDIYFCTNHAGVIYFTTTGPPAAIDEGGAECTIPRRFITAG